MSRRMVGILARHCPLSPFTEFRVRVPQVRAFIDLAGLQLSDSQSKTYHEKRVVQFTPEEVYIVVADVAKYKEFLPYCVNSRILRQKSPTCLEAELSIGFKSFTESYVSEVTMRAPTYVHAKAVESRLFKNLRSVWEVKPGPREGTSHLHFRVVFQLRNSLASAAISAFFNNVTAQQIHAFERRCHQLYPRRKRRMKNSQVAMTNNSLSTKANGIHDGIYDGVSNNVINVVGDKHDVKQRLDRLRDVIFKCGGDKDLREGQEFIRLSHFKEAIFELGAATNDEDSPFVQLKRDDAVLVAIHSSVVYMMRMKRNNKKMNNTESKGQMIQAWGQQSSLSMLDEFVLGVYMMVEASSEDRARFLFNMMDVNKSGKLCHDDLSRGLQTYMKSLSQVIPNVIVYHLRSQAKHGDAAAEAALQDMNHTIEICGIAVTDLLKEIKKEIPLAVDQVFEQLARNNDGEILEDQWLSTWNRYPELLDMMSLQGMSKMVGALLSLSNPKKGSLMM